MAIMWHRAVWKLSHVMPRSDGYKVMHLIDIVRDSRAVVLDKLKEDPDYVILCEQVRLETARGPDQPIA